MRSTMLAMMAVAALTAGSALAGDPPNHQVKVETSRALYEPGDTVEISVINERPGAIALPGCESFQVQLFDAEAYRTLSMGACVSEGDAIAVAPGRHELSFTPGDTKAGILRVVVTFGWGCEEGKPLSQARCKDFGTAWSSNFRVGRKAD